MIESKPLSLALAATMGAVGPAMAATPSGQAVAVVPSAAASGTGGNRTLQVNGSVFQGDVIQTSVGGSAQVKFLDDTKLVVGPNSQVTIDSFVFKGETATNFSLDAVKGTFRFITGASAKNAYTIKTPSATIGVRGTEFDFAVNQNGTHVGLWGGQIRICDRGVPRRCTTLTGSCQVVIVTPARQIQRVNNIYARTDLMNTLFPFAFRQRPLQQDFRVESGSCEIYDNFAPNLRRESSDPQAPTQEPVIDCPECH